MRNREGVGLLGMSTKKKYSSSLSIWEIIVEMDCSVLVQVWRDSPLYNSVRGRSFPLESSNPTNLHIQIMK